ncbi:MAG: hypothetical protein V1876_04350, partial [Candidatus Peregrinibacteria bacterium]
MASSPRHFREDGTPRENGHENGRKMNVQLAREWLGIEGELTVFSLLGIAISEQDPACIQDAYKARIEILKPHINNPSERHDAEKIRDELAYIASFLSDPSRRHRYLLGIKREQLRAAVRQQLPGIIVRSHQRPGAFHKMSGCMKRHPALCAASATVVAGIAGLFTLLGGVETPQKSPASAEQRLPEDAPELRQPAPP